jgi:hypothetical protein
MVKKSGKDANAQLHKKRKKIISIEKGLENEEQFINTILITKEKWEITKKDGKDFLKKSQ